MALSTKVEYPNADRFQSSPKPCTCLVVSSASADRQAMPRSKVSERVSCEVPISRQKRNQHQVGCLFASAIFLFSNA